MDAKGMKPIAVSSGLHIPEHDLVTIAYDTTFDTLTYTLGTTTVATVVVTFTDGTKTDISTVERTV